jgi:TonB-dependent starch-binding outer membrane protein SusC
MNLKFYQKQSLKLCLALALLGNMESLASAQSNDLLAQNSNKKITNNANLHMADILKELEVKYNVFFTYKDKTLKGKIVPQNIKRTGKLENILESLLKPQNVEYKKVGNVFYLYSPEELIESKNSSINSLPSTSTANGLIIEERSTTNLLALNGQDLKALTVAIDPPIKGKVVAENGDAMPGVSIRLKGSTVGAASDLNGNYSINIPDKTPNATLVFSMIGYSPMEVLVKNRTLINISMSPDVKSLNEVVVIGYGTQQRKDLTGSISSIQMGEIKNQAFTSLDQAMQGRAAGVTVNNNTGQPGGGVSVRIRGITSVSSTNEPLYVIDGIPMGGDGDLSGGNNTFSFSILGGGGGQTKQNALSALNPNDIVSIDILKDASATAIYGSRASNGVVIVTTKRGKAGESKINYDTYYGFQTVPKKLEVMNLQEYAAYQNEIRPPLGLLPTEEFANPAILGSGTNWQNEVFQRGAIQNHQLSFSGGKDNFNYYVSANLFDQQGTVIGSDFNRGAIRINLDNQVKSWLKLGISSNIGKTKQKITLTDTNDGVIGTALLQSPAVPVRNIDGSFGAVDDPQGYITINPVAQALLRTMTRDQLKINGNAWVDIALYKGLSFRGELGGDFGFTDNLAFNPTFKYGRQENKISKLLRRYESNNYWNSKQLLNYNKVFNIKHRVSAVLGHEVQANTYKSLGGQGSDLSTNEILSFNISDPKTHLIGDADSPWAMESYLLRANYVYDDFLNITGTFRRDGSSNFGAENRWGNFKSFATAWTLTKHEFMKSIPFISSLKLRVGYGEVGNQNIPGYSFGTTLNSFPTSFGIGYTQGRLPNPKVQWEAQRQTNAGIDLSFLNSKINITFDVYKKVSDKFLLLGTVPNYTGVGKEWYDVQVPYFNTGEMQNTGFDLAINTTNIEKSNGLKWNTNLVFSMYKNRLNSLDSPNTIIDNNLSGIDFSGETVTRTIAGQPVGLFYGYKVKGIFQSLEEVKQAPFQNEQTAPGDIQFQDLNNDGKINAEDRDYIGSPHPDFTFGFTNTLSFKGFDFSVFLSGAYGAEIYNYTRSRTEGLNDVFPNQLKTVVNRWTATNPNGGLPRFVSNDPNTNRRVSDRFIENGSFLRVQNISFGYVLPTNLIKGTFVKKIRLYGSLQNILTLTKYTGYDPELGSTNQNAMLSNVDGGNYPSPRTATMGLNVEF